MKKPSIFMQRRGLLFIICGLTATMIFCAGYVLAGLWLGAAFSLLLGLAWIAAWKQAQSNLPSLCLIAYACLGGGGILSGVPTALMIFGLTAALAAWDLLLLSAALGNEKLDGSSHLYENDHNRALVIALGGGLAVALLGSYLSLQIPFIFMLAMGAVVVYGLERIWAQFVKIR